MSVCDVSRKPGELHSLNKIRTFGYNCVTIMTTASPDLFLVHIALNCLRNKRVQIFNLFKPVLFWNGNLSSRISAMQYDVAKNVSVKVREKTDRTKLLS